MLTRRELHTYQQRAARFVVDNPYCALWLGLGLGKTVSTLTALVDLIDGMEVERVLVIAPLRVANMVWRPEAALWAHTQHLRVNVCTGTKQQRLVALDSPADIYVINRENVPALVRHYGKRWPFDCVVIDEASSVKSSKTQRWRALKKVRPYIHRLIELTGTMSPNGLTDLWAQFYLLDQGQRLGRTKTSFLNRWFESDYMGYNWTPRSGAQSEIHAAVADLVLSMEAEDYLSMPERVDVPVPVTMPEAARRVYTDLERDFLAEIAGEEVEALSAAALANKCLQACNGALYTDGAGAWVELHNAKLDALQEIVEDNSGEPLLVAYNYRTDLKRLQARFPDAVVLDKAGHAVSDWNKGRVQMLLAHPASAGHGLNLQHGGSTIIWFGLNWSLELYQQFNARIYRQGQQSTVRVLHLVITDGLDEKVMMALKNKAKTQQELITALKRPSHLSDER